MDNKQLFLNTSYKPYDHERQSVTFNKFLLNSFLCSLELDEKYKILNIHCSRADVSLIFNTGRNIICNFNLPKLCILDNELKCPRVSQVRSWLIKCRYLRHVMKKCINHRNLITNLKNNAKLQLNILLEI